MRWRPAAVALLARYLAAGSTADARQTVEARTPPMAIETRLRLLWARVLGVAEAAAIGALVKFVMLDCTLARAMRLVRAMRADDMALSASDVLRTPRLAHTAPRLAQPTGPARRARGGISFGAPRVGSLRRRVARAKRGVCHGLCDRSGSCCTVELRTTAAAWAAPRDTSAPRSCASYCTNWNSSTLACRYALIAQRTGCSTSLSRPT